MDQGVQKLSQTECFFNPVVFLTLTWLFQPFPSEQRLFQPSFLDAVPLTNPQRRERVRGRMAQLTATCPPTTQACSAFENRSCAITSKACRGEQVAAAKKRGALNTTIEQAFKSNGTENHSTCRVQKTVGLRGKGSQLRKYTKRLLRHQGGKAGPESPASVRGNDQG